MAGGIFPILNEYRKDIDFSNAFRSSTYSMILSYENIVEGGNSNKIYSIISDFNGDPLGSLIDEYYQNLTRTNFPNSKIFVIESFYDIFTKLLIEEIEGCLLDKPFVNYFINRYRERVTV